jgi:hypothetical protein
MGKKMLFKSRPCDSTAAGAVAALALAGTSFGDAFDFPFPAAFAVGGGPLVESGPVVAAVAVAVAVAGVVPGLGVMATSAVLDLGTGGCDGVAAAFVAGFVAGLAAGFGAAFGGGVESDVADVAWIWSIFLNMLSRTPVKSFSPSSSSNLASNR